MCRSRPKVYVCTLQKTRGVYALAVVMAGHVTPCFDSIQLVDGEHSRVSPGLQARRLLLMCTHLSTHGVCPLTSPSRYILGLMVIQSRYCHKDWRVYAQRKGSSLTLAKLIKQTLGSPDWQLHGRGCTVEISYGH